ncbi:GH25 family lysozyme [Pelosinus sp. IPA-1]|uniref:GH25 family lysozyme n=1 Tax=Pelosinus sp. IPA-1 TaxID=3029569 RepID=UPI0024361B09|nr:GH25 family lysozyme [Pelosinus sp. IPA-1]GMB01087.1 glycoside hydrolase family 25 [Pelosinus sp. IPA-1]
MQGIDVSENNGEINWQAVADAGIEFVIVRSSYGRHGVDEKFLENVNGAQTVGLKVGAYHYGYALTPEEAIEEAQNCKNVINEAGVMLELPIFYDMEDADGYKRNHDFNASQENVTEICKTFIDNLGLNCGVYASYSWLTDYIDWQSLNCPIWNAQWGGNDDIKGFMWQYTDSLEIGDKLFDGNQYYIN